jgi:hypothetical protein
LFRHRTTRRRVQIVDQQHPATSAALGNPRCLPGREAQQTRYGIECCDARRFAHIALHDGFDIVAVPSTAPRVSSARKRRRISTSRHALREITAETWRRSRLEFAFEECVEKCGRLSRKFGPRE